MASDLSAEDALKRVLRALEEAEVPYMLTGSFASTFHGAYVGRWVVAMGLEDEWLRAQEAAGLGNHRTGHK